MIGPGRFLRHVTLELMALAWVFVIAVYRPDLIRPADIGSDTSNYYAAGLRLAEGQPLYALISGGRPVPADFPHLFSVPILSPPPLAGLWRLLAAAPGGPIMYGWWLGGLLVTTLTVGLLVAWSRRAALIVVVPLLLAAAEVAWSGNVNAYLFGALVFVWVGAEIRAGSAKWLAMAGVAAAVAAGFKLTPVLLVWWLVCRRRWMGVAAAAVTAGILLIVTLAAVGPAAFVEYLTVARETAASGATALSPAGLLRTLGAPEALVAIAVPLVALAAAGLIAVARQRPVASYTIAIVGVVYASPVVHFETLSFLLACPILWARTSGSRAWFAPALDRLKRARPSIVGAGVVAIVGVVAAVSVALSNWAGSSSAIIENGAREPVTVRFLSGDATFGFALAGGQSGRGWLTIPGQFDGRILVYDDQCDLVAHSARQRTAGPIRITFDGNQLLTGELQPNRPTPSPLAYTSRCAAAAQ